MARFILASWNSYSKSATARSPRSTQWEFWAVTKSMSRPLKGTTSAAGTCPSTDFASATRVSRSKRGAFFSLVATATTTRSNSLAARSTRSTWPLVMGSKVPGYTTVWVNTAFVLQIVLSAYTSPSERTNERLTAAPSVLRVGTAHLPQFFLCAGCRASRARPLVPIVAFQNKSNCHD